MDPKFMSVKEAASQLLQIIENKPDAGVYFYQKLSLHQDKI